MSTSRLHPFIKSISPRTITTSRSRTFATSHATFGMATPLKIHLDVSRPPIFSLSSMNETAARKASDLLQENHDKHHIFFNKAGFHNHIAHHLLTLYAIGATPSEIQRQYDHNKGYQRPPMPVGEKTWEALHDPVEFKEHLGKEKYYPDYLVFFKEEMKDKGWQTVVNEYLFKGDERAEDLLVRLYAGFLHPLIHLGFGIEFQQPAIIAEALAQACCHDSWIGNFLLPAEQRATNNPSKSLVDLLDDIYADKELNSAPLWKDDNKIRDGILARAGDKMISYASSYTVPPSASLEEKTAEMINVASYFTACAQNPPHKIMFDFYYMHSANASMFFSAFNAQDWIADKDKRRLLAWKGRIDLAMYASRASPKLLLNEISDYTPTSSSGQNAFERVRALDDDGHASKLIRAFAHGAVVSSPYEAKDEFRFKARHWEKMGDMVIDSVEKTGDEGSWIRSAGFREAWEKIPKRMGAQL